MWQNKLYSAEYAYTSQHHYCGTCWTRLAKTTGERGSALITVIMSGKVNIPKCIVLSDRGHLHKKIILIAFKQQ